MHLNVERFGVYLRVVSLEQSRAFYERVLGNNTVVANDRLVAFELAGGMLALFEDGDEQQVRGRNAVPYIRVSDAIVEFDRLQRLGIRLHDEQVLVEGPIKLFRCSDPDGNMLEIFRCCDEAPSESVLPARTCETPATSWGTLQARCRSAVQRSKNAWWATSVTVMPLFGSCSAAMKATS